ncbi:MAG: hypothetical protein NTY37_05880 [Methanothrix sp.]|nr:hypothetical protein [Methanothrix sp.]
MVKLIGKIHFATQLIAIFSVFLLLNVYVIIPALADIPNAADASRCDGLAAIKSARDAVINTSHIYGEPGNHLSKSGSFTEHPPDSPCDPDVTYGPFDVASGGKLNASILGIPPVPSRWSLGDYNSGMTIYYEPKYASGYGPGMKILGLSGQHEDNNLKGSAEWPGSGRLTMVISAPRGSGPLTAGSFTQDYTAIVDIVSLNREKPAKAGTAVQAGDRIHTGPSGSAFLDLTYNGASLGLGPNTDVYFQASGPEISEGTPQLENPVAQVQMKLDELFDQRLPMPRGYYLDPKGFLNNFHESTITDALGIIKTVDDPCEASVELKLFLDSHQGEWTSKKSVETAWTLFGVDGWDLLESAYLTIPVYGPVTAIASAVDDWKDRWEVFSQEYKDEMANKQAEVALNAFKSSKEWTREELESGLESLNNEISDTQAKIGKLKQAYFAEALEVDKILDREQLAERRLETFGEVSKLERKLGTLILQKKAILRYRAPIVMGTCDRDLKTPKIPVLQPCPGSATRLQLNEGTVRYSDDNPPDKNGLKIELGGNTITHKNTEIVCEKHGDSCKVTVIKGNVTISNSTRPEIMIGAGQQIDLGSGTITSFNVSTDDGSQVDGIPLRDLPLDDASGLPYGLYIPNLSNDTVPAGWLWQDPGNDVRVETPEPGTLKVTVPDGNEFWDARTQAPRMLHKVTGDFDLNGEMLLKSNGTDQAVSEFLMYSPGSYLGYLAKQMNPDGLGAHYRVIGGGWLHLQGMNKLLLLNEKLADGPNAPDLPVRFRLTRHGDIWMSYWSPDGVHWNISTRQEIAAPETVWVGWLFKRNAYDGLRSEPAITALRDVWLETAPKGSMNDSDWDLVQGAGKVQADNSTVHMELDGSSLGTLYAFKRGRLKGDFDAMVRFQAENWTRQPGESRQIGLSADSLDEKTLAFIGIQEKDNVPERYMTDLGINEMFGRYQWKDTSDFGGYLRILRQKGNLSTYYWSECQWVRLDKFGAGFSDPVYIRMWISNRDDAKVNARLSVDFTIEQIITGEAVGKNWTPAYCSIFQSASLPTGLKVPDGMEARIFQSPFALHNIFL